MTEGTPLAAVDLGSNSFRLEIGRLERGQLVRIEYLKEMVRLGGGLNARSELDQAATRRGLECLSRFGERLRGFGPHQVRAVATQTLREAVNRQAFLLTAQTALGFPIEVISGREEARLIYGGVSHLLPDQHERRLVVDIGGRSTEVILGVGLEPQRAESYRVGSVSLSQQFFSDGRFSRRLFEQARVAALAVLEEMLGFAPKRGRSLHGRRWDKVYGSSGTAGAAVELAASFGDAPGTLSLTTLDTMMEELIRIGSVERLQWPGLKDERKPVIAGGLVILRALFELLDLKVMDVAKGALRQGVLFELGARSMGRGDVRDSSVARLCAKFSVDLPQAQRVETLALALYAQVAPQAEPERVKELRWASRWHEIGSAVSHADYHRHGAYIVAHADVAGFSQPMLERLSQLVLGQRGGLRKLGEVLGEPGFAQQLACLRLAVLLCHARNHPPQDVLSLSFDSVGFVARPLSDWLDANPQTLYLLRDEEAAWAKTPWSWSLQH
jgi:exopolyphosphatase/guanosine-5'-triphosphate,3'-diphosphate pyrophosphatase